MKPKDIALHIKSMNGIERRAFLKRLSLVLSAGFVTETFRFDCLSAVTNEAYANNQTEPMFFLEVNLRDQWDIGQAIVAPGIARQYDNLSKAGGQGLACFKKPELRNGLWLTADSLELEPHANSIAVMETGEVPIGKVHGHEASNAMRSPGRIDATVTTPRAGQTDMSAAFPMFNGSIDANQIHYSSTPTPAILHNYHTLSVTQNQRRGIAMRSFTRPGFTQVYHHAASLANAQLDQLFTELSLQQAFRPADNAVFLAKHSNLIHRLVDNMDKRFMSRFKDYSNAKSHGSSLTEATTFGQPFNISMSAAEANAWTSGIPNQVNCSSEDANTCVNAIPTAVNLGKMFGYAAKLFTSNTLKTAVIDFDYQDVHLVRTPRVLEVQAQQTARPLARLIASLKAAGIYNKTLIAIYTTDGSRSPKRESDGYNTKNAVLLAGGGVKGGYYGDIRMINGQVYYHRPDAKGNPVATGSTGAAGRVSGRDIYATVASMAGLPSSLYTSFPDVTGAVQQKYFKKTS